MKKSFFFMLLVAGGMSVSAQDTTDQQNTNQTNQTTTTQTDMNSTNVNMNNTTTDYSNMNNTNGTTYTLLSTGDYSAYSAPSHVQLYFTRDYPTVGTSVNWMPIGEWWRASYNDNGRYTHVFYTNAGDHYTVALPVTQTWVPDAVVSAASNMYGARVYDISALHRLNNSDVYVVRFLDNGTLQSEWLDETGVKVTEYYRTDDMNNVNGTINNTNTNLNVNSELNSTQNYNSTDANGSNVEKMKIKVEDDETKIKTKTVDGEKTKTKNKER